MTPERRAPRITFEEIVAKAKETMLRDSYHASILILEGNKSSFVHLISEVPETHRERLAQMRILGRSAAKNGKVGHLLQVFSISEGWLSMPESDQLPSMRPSQDPNKKEVLIISGLDKEQQKKYFIMFEMIRDEKQQVVRLADIETETDGDKVVELPLLDAFAQGFQEMFRAAVN